MELAKLKAILHELGAVGAVEIIQTLEAERTALIQGVKEQGENFVRQREVYQERLAQAAKREESFKETVRDLELKLRKLQANELSLHNEIERMESHPEVRAMKAARLDEQIASLTQQRSKLVSKDEPKEEEKKGEEKREEGKEPQTPAPNVQVEHSGEARTGE